MKTTPTYNGLFLPESGNGSGHLKLAGRKTKLTRIGHEEDEHPDDLSFDVHGHLVDGRKASLLESIRSGYTIRQWGGKRQVEDKIFPHYVLVGPTFLKSDQATIQSIRFYSESFYAFATGGSFNCLPADRPLAQNVLQRKRENSERRLSEPNKSPRPFHLKTGEHPVVFCYDGQIEIASCQSDVGIIRFENAPSYQLGGPKGLSLENQIVASISFSQARTFNEAIHTFICFQNFLELVLGHSPFFEWIEVELTSTHVEGDFELNDRLDLYWSHAHDPEHKDRSDKSRDATLIVPELHPAEFETVAAGWMNGSKTLQQARGRSSITSRGVYGADRLVGAANKFDLLPDTHVPTKITLSNEERDTTADCKRMFKALPDSFARQSVLSALGRVGSASLRDKILHRAQVIVNASGTYFEGIETACGEAVICRNHFVHGSPASFDYDDEFESYAFLTDTLEFVFGISDLVEQGLNFERWRENYLRVSHPFGAYTSYFCVHLNLLNRLLNKA